MFFQSSTVQCWWDAHFSSASCCWLTEVGPAWSSSVVAQDSMICVSHCSPHCTECLCELLKPFYQLQQVWPCWPSLINKVFLSQIWIFFCIPNSRSSCAWKPQEIKNQPFYNQTCHNVDTNETSWFTSAWFYALYCCNMIGYLDNLMIE